MLLDKYKKLLYSYVPAFIFGTLVQMVIVKNNIGSSLYMMFAAVFVLIMLRYGIERFKLVKEQDLKYVTPGLIVLAGVGLLIGSIFSDSIYNIISGFVSLALVQNPGAIGYTVAEQQPGNWNTIAQLSSLQFFPQIQNYVAPLSPLVSLLNPVSFYSSIYFLMFIGILAMLYQVVRKRQFIFLLPFFWVIASIWGVFLFIRLVFLYSFPAALLAGLGVAWLLRKIFLINKYEKLKPATKYLPAVLVVLIALLVTMNVSNAFVYGQNLGPSICFPNPQFLIEGERCLDINEDGSFTYASGQPWYEAMTFMREQTPKESNILTWWDFGHWFAARGERGSVADGGKGRREPIAWWYTASVDEWDKHAEWMSNHKVTHILQDYTLPGKYGAISAIATEGQGTVGIQQFNQGNSFQEGNRTIQEFNAGQFAIWLPITQSGTIDGTPIFLVSQGGQYVNNGFINDVCTRNGILHTGDRTPSVGGCVVISDLGVYYVPEQAKNTIFVSLMFMEGAGLPVEKVFDNTLIKIFSVKYDTLSSNL